MFVSGTKKRQPSDIRRNGSVEPAFSGLSWIRKDVLMDVFSKSESKHGDIGPGTAASLDAGGEAGDCRRGGCERRTAFASCAALRRNAQPDLPVAARVQEKRDAPCAAGADLIAGRHWFAQFQSRACLRELASLTLDRRTVSAARKPPSFR